jgi:hypothetical protein
MNYISMPRFLYLLLLVSASLHAQTPVLVAEMDITKSYQINLRGHPLGEGVQFFYEDKSVTPVQAVALRVVSTEKQISYRLENMTKKIVLAARPTESGADYYYLDPGKKGMSIHVLHVNETTGSQIVDTVSLKIPGKLIGAYSENEKLYVISAVPDQYKVQVTIVADMAIVQNQEFKLTFSPSIARSSRFLQEGQELNLRESAASLKVIKSKNNILYLCMDDRPANTEGGSGLARTVVAELDLATGAARNRVIFEQGTDLFSSTVFGDHLYRLKKERGFLKLEIVNLETGKAVYAKTFDDPEKSFSAIRYFRSGLKRIIEKEEIAKPLKSAFMRPFIVVDSSAGEVVAKIGFWKNDDPLLVPNPSDIVGLVTSSLLMAIVYTDEGEVEGEYVYIKGTVEKGFIYDSNSPMLQRQIDDFEIGLDGRYSYKGYIYSPDIIFAIYRDKKSKAYNLYRLSKSR